MKLDNLAITATIDGEPVMVILDKDQIAMLPNLIAACDKTGKCRVTKLDPEKYRPWKRNLESLSDKEVDECICILECPDIEKIFRARFFPESSNTITGPMFKRQHLDFLKTQLSKRFYSSDVFSLTKHISIKED